MATKTRVIENIETSRATRAEIIAFRGERRPVEQAIIDARWLPARPTKLAVLAAELRVDVVRLDRIEGRMFNAMAADLTGGGMCHPVYDRDLSFDELEEQAVLLSRGRTTHLEIAKSLGKSTSEVRRLIGKHRPTMKGRMLHGVSGYVEHGCRCETCDLAFREAMTYYAAGGSHREVSFFSVGECQESDRVFFVAGHVDIEAARSYCTRTGIAVTDGLHAWWKKQRARLWWVRTQEPGTQAVTVLLRRFPEVRPLDRRSESMLRRWSRGRVEVEVVTAALCDGSGRGVVDVGWSDGAGLPSPVKQATHIGVDRSDG